MKINAMRVLQGLAAAVVLTALAFGGVSAAEKKKEAAPKPAACRTIMAEAECTTRDDCTWRDAVKKGEKITRRASCAAKPKPKPSKKKT
jgi:hypothetical protein